VQEIDILACCRVGREETAQGFRSRHRPSWTRTTTLLIQRAARAAQPSKFGKGIHFNGTKRSVTDGPFAETKELVVRG